tara:strand:- start:1528 stop:2286 length:759 start_codon:yes stop_codon:yes gene_type:complete
MKKLLLLVFVCFLMSCATRKNVVQFQDAESLPAINIDSIYHHPEIQVNDILKIDLTALEPESLMPFQFEKAEASVSRQGDLLKLEGFLVNKNGEINFPSIGLIKVSGLDTQQLQNLLEKRLSRYIKDPTVRVRLVNFKFSVMGEVQAPGTYTLAEETITIPQALAMAGDLTIYGKRKNVLLIRRENDVMASKRIDLTKTDWINSSYYFLRPNDLIYVEPNNPKIKSSGFVSNIGTLLSVVSILMSAAVLIFR